MLTHNPTHLTVTHENWQKHEAFLEFLRFEFSLDNISAEARQHINTLLPLSVAENRLAGAIKEAILKEAMSAFNRPYLYHTFVTPRNKSAGKWKYIGSSSEFHRVLLNPRFNYVTMFGALRRPLIPGAFCRPPEQEIEGVGKRVLDTLRDFT